MSERFDVFLSHASVDKPLVEEVARRLQREGLRPWLDKWNLVPGAPWQEALEKALESCGSCAVFIGPGGFGNWQDEEMRRAIDRRVADRDHAFRVIPVLLPGVERPQRSQLPGFLVATTWVEFRNTIEDGEALRRLVCGIRGEEPGAAPDEAAFAGRCPYRGLELFDVEHAPLFFGREALTEWLVDALRRKPSGAENRFLAIIGASGSGKSSLARAGLLAALRNGKLEGSSHWPLVIFRPGYDPLLGLANAIKGAALEADRTQVFDRMHGTVDAERSLHVSTALALGEPARAERLVLLVDQFEEVFTLCADDSARRRLIVNLLHAANVPDGRTIVILTMRADFYPQCAAHADLAAALSDRQVLVGPLTSDELRRAIERPARLAGLEPEPGLVELLVDDVRGHVGALPLLQFALQELWNRREGHLLALAAYRAIGGLEGALQRKADAVFDGFSPEQKELCRRVFLRLVKQGEGSEDTRRRARLRDVIPEDPRKAAAVRAVINRLADPEARLVTTEREPAGSGEGTLEVAHEALIRGWPELRRWIEADRAGNRTRERLTEAAKEWREAPSESQEGCLLSGARLAVAREWAEENPELPSREELAFLKASLDAERRKRFRAAMVWLAIGGLLIALVPAVGFGLVAWRNAREARSQAETANGNSAEARKQAIVARVATKDLLAVCLEPCEIIGRIATAETPSAAKELVEKLLAHRSIVNDSIRARLTALRSLFPPDGKDLPVVEGIEGRPTYRFENKDVLRALLELTAVYSKALEGGGDSPRTTDPAIAEEGARLKCLLILESFSKLGEGMLEDLGKARDYEASKQTIQVFWRLYYGQSYLVENLAPTEGARAKGRELESAMVRLREIIESWRKSDRPPGELPRQASRILGILQDLRTQFQPD